MIRNGLLGLLLLAGLLLAIPSASLARLYGKKLCQQPGYDCLTVKKKESWQTLFPNEDLRALVKRINRMNTELYPGIVLAIPEDKNNSSLMAYSPFPLRIDPPGRKVIFINLLAHAFGAYDETGILVHWGPVSGGKGWCPDVRARCNTPTGDFHIYAKGDDSCKSSKYPIGEGGAPMSHCMYFYGGYALHASFLPGYHASHGCVRLFDEDAEWLNRHFITLGKNQRTDVIIRKINPFEEETTHA